MTREARNWIVGHLSNAFIETSRQYKPGKTFKEAMTTSFLVESAAEMIKANTEGQLESIQTETIKSALDKALELDPNRHNMSLYDCGLNPALLREIAETIIGSPAP